MKENEQTYTMSAPEDEAVRALGIEAWTNAANALLHKAKAQGFTISNLRNELDVEAHRLGLKLCKIVQ